MSSLAAARADNFYYPPDFDPQKHQTLNKYNGQHPLRERAAKLDQGILVIRFEVPFNIWCDKCGEHIAKGERFNAEKKAIGQYHSTKILQFTMSHHCGCKITIQTDPKRAEYLVVEGARKKEESYTAADAEVIELPDEEERERRERDPLYRLEYQQGAKAKALSAAERLAAIHDAVDERAADPFSLNRTMRAALRGEKRAAAALDARRSALGLPEVVPLLPAAESDGIAAQVAFLTSSARAEASAETRRKRILEQDIFAAAAGGGCRTVDVTQAAAKRQAVAVSVVAARAVAASRPASVLLPAERDGRGSAWGSGGAGGSSGAAGSGGDVAGSMGAAVKQRQPTAVRDAGEQHPRAANAAGSDAAGGRARETPPAAVPAACKTLHGAGKSGSGGAMGAAMAPGTRAPPGAAALAAAAAARAGRSFFQPSPSSRVPGGSGVGVRPGGVKAVGNQPATVMASGGAGGTAGGVKRSINERAAELQKRRQGPGGVGLAVRRAES